MNKILMKIAASAGAPASVVVMGLVSVVAKAALSEVVSKYAHAYFKTTVRDVTTVVPTDDDSEESIQVIDTDIAE